MKLQGLNSRGNVEKIMKDVKSQAARAGGPGKGDEKEQLLRDCIDEVMQLLQNTKER